MMGAKRPIWGLRPIAHALRRHLVYCMNVLYQCNERIKLFLCVTSTRTLGLV